MVRIAAFEEAHLPQLVELVNMHLRSVPPYGARVDARAVETALRFYEALWAHHYPALAREPNSCTSFVALEGADVLGLVVARPEVLHLEEDELGEENSAELSLFLFHPARPDAGERLIAAAMELLSARGAKSVDTPGRCPVGLGWSGIPEGWLHVTTALSAAGFEHVDGWALLFGDTREMETEPPPLPPSMHVLFTPYPERREWRLEVYHHDRYAAECEARCVPPHLEHCEGFDEWVVIEWIGVDEEFRGRGLGFWLMMKQLLYHLRGGRHRVLLWTGPENDIALRFYRRLGFEDGPRTRVYRRSL